MTKANSNSVNPAATIDEVIERLDAIIDWAKREQSRLGYFAALYRTVTVRVRDGIARDEFEDGARMEKLDVIFANRYLRAFDQHRAKEQPTQSWDAAFLAADKWRFLIIQQLLLGINAHINLDLGIAAAETSPVPGLQELKNDFHRINSILSSLLDTVQEKINSVSPGFKFLDKVGGRTDEAVMNFSIERARDEAWAFAQEYASTDEAARSQLVSRRDQSIAGLARRVQSPGRLISFFAFFIRLFESSNITRNIDVLF